VPVPARPGLNLSECVFGACRLELADFLHAVRHEPRTRELIQLATAVGAAACVSGMWLMTTPDYRRGVLLFGVGVVCFAAHNAPEHIAQRWFAKTPRGARDLRYTLNPQGLIVASELSQQSYAWTTLQGYKQAPDCLLVWVSSQLFIIVPKRAFKGSELPQVIERFEREVGAPAASPRFWSWLLLGVMLTLGGLWLWNRLAPR
jgi:hypothetical protein